jgi:hypothetical protein
MLILRAAAVLLCVGVGSAYAVYGDGQSAPPPPFDSTLAEFHSVLAGPAQTSPLFTIGGFEVRVWAPVASPYNAETTGDLATRDIWSSG